MTATNPCIRRTRSGFALIYLTITMVALLAFASLAVDYGRAQVAKTELLRAADAAARYGVIGLSDGTAVSRAQSAAADNTADGRTVTLAAGDVQTGLFDPTTQSFTPGAASPNAVRVTCALRGSSGVPTLFAQVLGRDHVDVTATAIAMAVPTTPAFVGLDSISIKNNTFFGSYSSSTTTTPTQSSSTGDTAVGTNGTLSSGNNNSISGNLVLGPGGSSSGIAATGSTTSTPAPIVAPSDPAWNPSPNPGGVPQNYTAASDVILQGGTYWFTSLNIAGNLSFSGPATVYVNGDVTVGESLTASGMIPGNLHVYQLNSHTFGDASSNNVTICGVITAPTCDLVIKNNLTFYGSALFRTITLKNNAGLFYDGALGNGSGGVKVTTVK